MRSRAKSKTPESQVRELGKIPCNKMCADCGDKLPGYANLSLNCFVCRNYFTYILYRFIHDILIKCS